MLGNEGKDFIKSGKGFDEIRAGKGDDEIHTRDGKPDQIKCGPGEDTVLADEVEDDTPGCETVEVLTKSPASRRLHRGGRERLTPAREGAANDGRHDDA